MNMKKRFLSILLTLALTLALMPGMSLTAYADNQKAYAAYDVTTSDNKTKSGDALTALQVKFNGKSWYIIADNSTAVDAGTVTLLAAESLGISKFHDFSNAYSTSTIRTTLDNMTASGGSFAGVASAINTVKVKGSASDTEVDAKLYLLDTTEASNVPENVRKSITYWWLRSPGSDDYRAAYVGGSGGVSASGTNVSTGIRVRPALKLNLSSVIFSSESKTFQITAPADDTPAQYSDVATPTDSFTFKVVWKGGSAKDIDFTLYKKDGSVYRHGFNKKTLGSGEWRYSAWFSSPIACYVLQKPMKGYQISYENVGIYAGVTDRCCPSGTICIYKVPQTGDAADLALWLGMVAAGSAILGGLAVKRRKRREA